MSDSDVRARAEALIADYAAHMYVDRNALDFARALLVALDQRDAALELCDEADDELRAIYGTRWSDPPPLNLAMVQVTALRRALGCGST